MGCIKAKCIKIRAGFYGTHAQNFKSIFNCGLLVPGQSNRLVEQHSGVDERGVHVVQNHAAWLSFSFCTAPEMLVCAVLDAGHVTYLGDAMVVGRSAHVVPLFVARGRWLRNDSVALTWSRKAAAAVARATNGACFGDGTGDDSVGYEAP